MPRSLFDFKIKKSHGIKLKDLVVLKKGYASYPIGKVGQVVRIVKTKPHTTTVTDLKPGDWSVKEHKNGSATIKLHGVPKKMFGKPTATTHFIKAGTTFDIDFSGKSTTGYGSISLRRKEFLKAPKGSRIGERRFK